MDPKQLMLAHFEKLLLALGAGSVILAASSMLEQPKELAQSADLQTRLKQIGKHFDEAKGKQPAAPGWLAAQAADPTFISTSPGITPGARTLPRASSPTWRSGTGGTGSPRRCGR